MSEQAPQPSSKETNESLSNHELDAIKERLESDIDAKAEQAKGNQIDREQVIRSVEQHAISGKEMAPSEVADKKNHPVLINKQLKDMAYSRSMTRVRKKLSLPSKAFSKMIHSNALDKPSEFVGKTIARPSGMLGGAFFAAIGSSLLLWITKNYGYEYNYLAILLLFAAGLIIGLSVEAIWKSLKRRS